MEPIRPDDDELRAEPRAGSAPKKAEPIGKPGAAAGKGGDGNGGSGQGKGGRDNPRPAKTASSDGGGRGGQVALWVVLLVVAAVAAGGWFNQSQRIEALEGQLEEADHWARQSKLALARFEGDLSETGENLEERGQSIEQKLADQGEQLDDHEARLESIAGDVTQEGEAREALATSVETLESSLADELSSVREDLGRQIVTLKESTEQADQRLTELNSAVDGVDQLVDRRIQRFEREQKLGMDGLESRIGSLERSMDEVADGSAVNSVRSELNELKATVDSIDSSRAQLTSRLVRLSQQVDTLRSQTSSQ
ncbi:hypothetical protein [Marinobacter sp.]|uniref:hypothetical protein n=1 Tax=Marinobacter sp. TaxID=50741 RepID=UPI0034A324EC